ncbi:DUF6875 domain-containing protein [Streptomyces antimicrobicus]|uniref:DUF6875 domain-containing protein n=1 Tax=Streptomyces antimicrobicus TaxID=2883108 RepID=A0ABS8B1T9_9ACTN|nr:hypothetical protein [Streptomyces antimicrobicus]MCB5178532.1 hypothetical protein [Streptomyces antimicrobicus]
MRGDDLILSWTASEVARGEVPPPHAGPLLPVLLWSKDFLVSSHPELGRTGPVCPYTQPSLRKDLFHLALPSADCEDLSSAVDSLRTRHAKLSAPLSPEDRELLTILLVLPGFDPTDSTELDELQRKAKDEFVAEGLMIGQFHPLCEEPGLYNDSFRPLRSPVPLLAVRKLLVFDLPFLVGDDAHMDHYLQRFAPEIPTRIRDQLVSRVVA